MTTGRINQVVNWPSSSQWQLAASLPYLAGPHIPQHDKHPFLTWGDRPEKPAAPVSQTLCMSRYGLSRRPCRKDRGLQLSSVRQNPPLLMENFLDDVELSKVLFPLAAGQVFQGKRKTFCVRISCGARTWHCQSFFHEKNKTGKTFRRSSFF